MAASLQLNQNVLQAIAHLRSDLTQAFPIKELVLFGSTARGDAGDFSDIDVLVICTEPISHETRMKMVDAAFEVNLEHDTAISLSVVDEQSWQYGWLAVSPFHTEVAREGVPLWP